MNKTTKMEIDALLKLIQDWTNRVPLIILGSGAEGWKGSARFCHSYFEFCHFPSRMELAKTKFMIQLSPFDAQLINGV